MTQYLSQFCKYFTFEIVAPKKHYTYEKAPGQIVHLEGKAKKWAIEVQTLKNEQNQIKNVYNLCSTLFGIGLSVRAWWCQSYFPLIIWTPFMTLGHNYIWRKIESRNPLIAALNVGISITVQNEAKQVAPQSNPPKDWVMINKDRSPIRG